MTREPGLLTDLTARPAVYLLGAGLVLLLAQAFVPLEHFILRGDDAFYYFQVAINHVRHGFWTFDGIHPTNGVQPLWAWLLTGLAHLLSWAGVSEPLSFARAFVGLTALVYWGACLVLYSLVRERVSIGTGLAVAGASILPLGVVWGRVWGMETAVYLLILLLAMAYFHRVFLVHPSVQTAAILGTWLGVCALARLNGGLFGACLVLYYLVRRDVMPRPRRFRFALIMGLSAGAILGSYLVWNLATTGHLLPISGAVKAVRAADARAEYGVESIRNALSMVYYGWSAGLQWLATSRLADGYWIVGARLVTDGAVGVLAIGVALAASLGGPLLAGAPREWLRELRQRFGQLAPFWYVALFAMVDAVVSMLVYPSEQYAATRWWLVPVELVLVVLAATLVVAAVSFLGRRWVPGRFHDRIVRSVILLLVLLHSAQFVRFFWGGPFQYRDWNMSWNDESLRAAEWVNQELPGDAVVGAWNAGVLGFFSQRPVVNLDGLINNFDLLPYLRERRVAEYIRREGITHLSDLEPMFQRVGVGDALPLQEVYRHRSEFMGADYVIYRIGAAAPDLAPLQQP